MIEIEKKINLISTNKVSIQDIQNYKVSDVISENDEISFLPLVRMLAVFACHRGMWDFSWFKDGDSKIVQLERLSNVSHVFSEVSEWYSETERSITMDETPKEVKEEFADIFLTSLAAYSAINIDADNTLEDTPMINVNYTGSISLSVLLELIASTHNSLREDDVQKASSKLQDILGLLITASPLIFKNHREFIEECFNKASYNINERIKI